jgi:hypothetical protein
MKIFQRGGFNNHEGYEEGTGLKTKGYAVFHWMLRHTAPADEIESDDADLIVQEAVPSNPDEVQKDIFKEMEEKNRDSHCEGSDSDDNSDVVITNHSRPLPSHKETLQLVSQLITHSSSQQPQFIGDLFRLYNSTDWQ